MTMTIEPTHEEIVARTFAAIARSPRGDEVEIAPAREVGAFDWPEDAQPGDLPGGGNIYERKAR